MWKKISAKIPFVTYKVLLYYKYVKIDEPKVFVLEQKELCSKLGLKGRVIIAKEGINGTLEGKSVDIHKYCKELVKDKRFKDTHFKISEGNGDAFPKLSIKVRTEIVTLGNGVHDDGFKKASHISPDEFQKWIDEKKDFVVIDMRNEYEYKVGQFEDSLVLPVQNFREIPEALEKMGVFEELKNKTIVPVCTGGVRCEKATSYLVEKGFTDVHQLEGGIVRYLEKHPGKKFKGSLYVFDNRIIVNYDSPEQHTVIGKCHMCGAPSERFINCEYLGCHDHVICCEDCGAGGNFCSNTCREKHVSEQVVLSH